MLKSMLYLLAGCALLVLPAAAQTDLPSITDDSFAAAAAYSDATGGDAVLVVQNGDILYEQYTAPYTADEPHLLASGTKSFSCAIAVAAIQDGYLTDFDQPAADWITEFADDPQKSQITVRQLLDLSSGIEVQGFDRMFRTRADAYQDAIETGQAAEPGAQFEYGASHYFVFGDVINRALAGSEYANVLDYLTRRILQPIGLDDIRWVIDRAGNPQLAGGAFTSARGWALYGQLILQNGEWEGDQILDPALLAQCFVPSANNPGYGLTWWLSYPSVEYATRLNLDMGDGIVQAYVAAGAGNQRLYVIPSLEMVIVRLARQDRSWNDQTFIETLFGQITL
jgi:CubicO group peptidase (beta-lactamase class C family)